MKTIIYLLLTLLISVSSKTLNAQLNNTAWKGIFMVPQATECAMVFRGDTAYLVIGTDFYQNKINPDAIIETSIYQISKDTLTIQKLSGGSPCSGDIIGKYSFVIKDSLLSISVINDDCSQRANAFPIEPLPFLKNKE